MYLKSFKESKNQSGFSLLEVLLTIAVLSILMSVSFGLYSNFSQGIELESAAKTIISDLKNARAKSMAGEDGFKWGIHFVNATSSYYEFFETPTDYFSSSSTIRETTYLPGIIIFSVPPSASSTDIIFDRILGTVATSTSITISSQGTPRVINVSPLGNIY
jgi:prepilin-type N-terminal cleavage/methylation domain-containing protein